MTLLDPWFLVVLPVVWLLFLWRLLRPRAALPTASIDVLVELPRTLRTRLRALSSKRITPGSSFESAVATVRIAARSLHPRRPNRLAPRRVRVHVEHRLRHERTLVDAGAWLSADVAVSRDLRDPPWRKA